MRRTYTSTFLLAVSSYLTLLETNEVFDEGYCWTTSVASMADIFPKTKNILIESNTSMKANLVAINKRYVQFLFKIIFIS